MKKKPSGDRTSSYVEGHWIDCWLYLSADMEFVQNFTPPDFQAKNFTPSISPNFNSFSKKKHKKWAKMVKFTPLAKILHCRRQWRHGQIPPLSICREIMIIAYFWQLGNRLSPAWCYIVAHLYLYKGNIIWQCASW